MPTATRSVSRHRSYLIALGIAACVAGMGVLLAALDPPIGWFDRSAAPEPLGRWSLVWVLLFVAAIIASTVGFAFSAIAGAMVLHFVPNGIEAVQIMMFASIGLQTYSVLALRRSIEWSRCLPFLGGGIAAMPLGIVLLLALHPRAYVLLMGAALIGYGLYMQFRRRRYSFVGSIQSLMWPLAHWAASPGRWRRFQAQVSSSGAACAAGTSSCSAQCTNRTSWSCKS